MGGARVLVCVSVSDVIYTRESVGGRVRDDDGRTGWLAGWLAPLVAL